MAYHFSTVKQFQAVLESMGYECYERDNQLYIKRDGCVIEHLSLSEISAKCQNVMDEFIDTMLEDNPDLTTKELNRMLRRQFGTHISKGRIAYGDDFIDLQDYMVDTLKSNDRKPTVIKEGSRDQNREWEVGRNNRYDDLDDERQLKR